MRYIRVDRRGPYTWITFDRPGKLNVLHAEDLPGLRDVIVNLDPGVTGLVFTGAGPAAFSAGMNIETFVGMDRAGAKSFIGQLAGIMQAIREAPVVTVAAVSGYCLGAAFELALACDLRVVTTTAAFGLPEIKVGVPSVIDAALLPGFVGLSKAREMILTGDSYRLQRLAQHRARCGRSAQHGRVRRNVRSTRDTRSDRVPLPADHRPQRAGHVPLTCPAR
jgi:enoyl-CoA hydratase/carnithine racemase